MNNHVYSIIQPILLCLFLLPSIAQGQSYSEIDSNLGIYCADLPDGTNAVVSLTSKGGLYNTKPIDPADAIKAIRKEMKEDQKKVSTLKKIKHDNDPTANLNTLKKIYTFMSDEGFTGTKPNKIFNAISKLITDLNERIKDLEEALKIVDRCAKNEDLIPPPQPGSAQVISFPFTHPDYGTEQIMRGLGVTGTLNKKAISGTLCVATSKPHSTLQTFPNESQLTIQRNPCLIFFQTAFRNFPFCSYGNKNTGTAWFSVTDVGFSLDAFDDDERGKLERKLAFYAPIHIRAPSKKHPCRLKKKK